MQLQTIKATTRPKQGSAPARRERLAGHVPSVLYGGGSEPVSLLLNAREFSRIVNAGGEHAVVQVEVGDNPSLNSPALLRAVEHHPVRGHIMHADFQRIRLDERIETVAELEFTGQAKGLVDGGIIDFQLRELEIECLALEVPESIKVNIAHLGIGDSLHVGEITVPEGVTVLTDADRPVVAMHAPRVEKAAEGLEGTTIEPELVGKDKKDEDEE